MGQVCRQIVAQVPDKVGRLAELADKIRDAGVNIRALLAWTEGLIAKLLMVADDNEKAREAIRPMMDISAFGEVVCTKAPNTPGALAEIAHKLAGAGINIRMVYAVPWDASEATIILDTTDNAKAAKLV